jgi:hypothetical protein
MENTDTHPQIAAIEGALRDRPDSTITGGQLFYLMQSIAPTLNFRELVGIQIGPGALTKFVENHLSGSIRRIGNQGGDVLYQLVGRTGGPNNEPEFDSLWKNFVSPSSPRHLVIEIASQRLAVRNTSASSEGEELEVAKASLTEHDLVRSKFMESLPTLESEAIMAHLPDNASFSDWIAAVKLHAPDAMRKWGLFRRDHLLALFTRRIESFGLDNAFHDKLIAQIKASQRATLERQKDLKPFRSVVPSSVSASTLRLAVTDSPIFEARNLAHSAIDLMGYDELRSLRVPLGMILDSIRSKN